MTRGKKKTYGNSRSFVPLDYKLLNSPAFIALSHPSKAALPYFMAKVKKPLQDPVRYETTFEFPYSEAKRYGFGRHTFSRSIQELMRHGFIDPVERGGLRGSGYSKSRFSLSERWWSYGKPEFKEIEWRQVQPRKKTKCRMSTCIGVEYALVDHKKDMLQVSNEHL